MPPKKGGKPKKTASGYRMPDHLPEGTMLTDLFKKQWTLGKSIGIGGFGEIYLAGEGQQTPKGDSAKHVVKIEPKENGPLFVEMHFYIQVGTAEHVKGWKSPVNLPLMRGQGSYKHKDDTYRFLVIDRFGVDLDKTFLNGKNPLAQDVIGTLAVQIMNTLEYIHSRGYTHNDVKAANLLLGLGKDSHNIYLVDFGLCVKYIKPDGHKEYKADPRKAHDGTIEYLSRDAHIGCTSRRSDLEVLCYNLFHWNTGTLPWIKALDNAVKVQGEKEKFMAAVPANFAHLPASTQQLFKYVKNLKFDEKPDYDKCRAMFKSEMALTGGKINLNASKMAVKSPKKATPKPAVKGRKKAAKLQEESPEELSDDDIHLPTPPKKSTGTPRAAARGRASGTPRDTPRGRGTPRGTPRGTLRTATVASMASADESDEPEIQVKPKKNMKKFSEAGCQTSPAFVASAAAAKRTARGRAANANDSESDTEPAKTAVKKRSVSPKKVAKKASVSPKKRSLSPKKVAKKPTKSAPKRKQPLVEEEKNDDNGDGSYGMDNPTPAMLAIMKRKQEVAEEKAAKKRKK